MCIQSAKDNNIIRYIVLEKLKTMRATEFGRSKLSDYIMEEKVELGKGAYGTVYKVPLRTDPSIVVAIKHIHCDVDETGIPSTSLREITFLREIDSPYIVKILDTIIENKELFIVFEHLNIDLKQYIDHLNKIQTKMNPQLVKKLLYQLIVGVQLIHERRIFHRDLKPANILLDKDMNLKIADFGLARNYTIPIRPYSEEVVTQYYRAPELLLGCREYSHSIDMWSVGCIFAEMSTNKILFKGDSANDQFVRIFRILGTPNEEVWPGVSTFKQFNGKIAINPLKLIQNTIQDLNLSEDGLDLLNSLLTLNPAKRITAKAALNHHYFKDILERMK